MGWLISYDLSKEQQVSELVAGWEKEDGKGVKCLDYSVRGNVLYAVMQPFETGVEPEIEKRWILVCLLRKDRGMGWGYKDMAEEMGPVEVNCPLKYLKMVPTVGCEAWRERVQAFHAKRRSQKPIEVGDTVRFKPGVKVLGEPLIEAKVTSKQGRGYLVDIGNGMKAKVFRRHFA